MAKDVGVAFFLCSPRCFHNLTKFPNLHTNQVAVDSYNTKEMMDFTVCLVEEVLCGHQLAALLLHKQKVFFCSIWNNHPPERQS